MVGRVQIKRTEIVNRAPTGLLPGELAVEMANPVRLWVGVPLTLDGSGRKALVDGSVSAIDAWSKAESDSRFVNSAGDQMSGDLSINKVNPCLFLSKAGTSGQANTIYGMTGGIVRWRLIPGTTTAETGANVGSDFAILRHGDAGAVIDTPFTINRATGRVEILNLDVKTSLINFGSYSASVSQAAFAAVFDLANSGITAPTQGLISNYRLGRSPGSMHLSGQFGLVTDGVFDGAANRSAYWRFNAMTAEVLRVEFDIGNGVCVGNAVGGRKGLGTINAVAVYDDNVQLTCYVIDAARTGKINLGYWDNLAGKTNERAHAFTERLEDLDVRTFARKWKEQGFLPGAPEPRKLDPDIGQHHSVGDLFSMLLEIVEVQAVHIDQLASEIDALKASLTGDGR